MLRWALGFFYRRINSGAARIHWHFGGSRGNRENFILSVLDSIPGHTNGAPAAQVLARRNI